MATTVQPATSETITTVERTWRINVETPKGGSYSMQLYREQHVTDSNNNVLGHNQNAGSYNLVFNDIKDESVTLGGVTLTVAQIAAFLQAYCDQKVAAVKAAAAAAKPAI